MGNQEIIFNENPEDEIISSLNTGNFIRAFKLSEDWLKSIPLEAKLSFDSQLAKQAFLLTRHLYNKQERLNIIQDHREKANFSRKILEQMIQISHSNEKIKSPIPALTDSRVWQTIHFILHSLIANSLAKVLAGQKAYKLDHEEIIQLATSLIFTGNWKASADALNFLLNVNRQNATAHLLQSYVSYSLHDETNFYIELREAFFIQPDVIKGNWHFLPGGIFTHFWDEVQALNLGVSRSYREYALLLELNNIYKIKREITQHEFEQFKTQFQTLYRNYVENGSNNHDVKPRLLHLLCWIIDYVVLIKDYDLLENYRDIMIELDNESWQLYNAIMNK